MKSSLELLYHFNCDRNPRHWWAIADLTWTAGKAIWCPHCGHQMQLPNQPLTGRDFTTDPNSSTDG